MHLDPNELAARDLYGWMVNLIVPRPIAWVSTLSPGGIANLAPFSYFNATGSNPPSVVFCPANRNDGTPKDTLVNVEATGQFVVNLVTESVADIMNQSAADYRADEDEFEMIGIAKSPSQHVAPPRVSLAEAALECEWIQTLRLGTGPAGTNLVIGRIVGIYVDDKLIDDAGRFRADQYAAIGRMGGITYVRTADRFDKPRPRLDR